MLFMKMTSNYLTIHSSSETFLCHYEFNFGVMKFTPKTDYNLPIQNPPLGGLSNSKVLSHLKLNLKCIKKMQLLR